MRIALLSISLSLCLAACGGKSSPALEPTHEPAPTLSCAPAGCSGTVCADATAASDIVTTCEYRNEYACYQSATCEAQADGTCGWTQTDELTSCLAAGGPPEAQ